MVELKKIATEQRNPDTMNIDTLSTLDMVKLINREDHKVAEAVGLVTDKIAQAVDVIADRLSKGGRLIYCGAGTSGRLGVLDAVECPPTYSTDPEMVHSLGNPQWSAEIPAAGKARLDLLVALKENVCAGFTGPVYPEETGRGYLSGVAVAQQYERNGLGTLLFYRLLQREKEVGAKYMSIFTGIDNRAKEIYMKAGFRIVRTFAVMRKEL